MKKTMAFLITLASMLAIPRCACAAWSNTPPAGGTSQVPGPSQTTTASLLTNINNRIPRPTNIWESGWTLYSADGGTSTYAAASSADGGLTNIVPDAGTFSITGRMGYLTFPTNYVTGAVVRAESDPLFTAASNALVVVAGSTNVTVTRTATGQVVSVTGGGGGAGTITNIISSDGSVGVSNGGGPVPDLTVWTNYVRKSGSLIEGTLAIPDQTYILWVGDPGTISLYGDSVSGRLYQDITNAIAWLSDINAAAGPAQSPWTNTVNAAAFGVTNLGFIQCPYSVLTNFIGTNVFYDGAYP